MASVNAQAAENIPAPTNISMFAVGSDTGDRGKLSSIAPAKNQAIPSLKRLVADAVSPAYCPHDFLIVHLSGLQKKAQPSPRQRRIEILYLQTDLIVAKIAISLSDEFAQPAVVW